MSVAALSMQSSLEISPKKPCQHEKVRLIFEVCASSYSLLEKKDLDELIRKYLITLQHVEYPTVLTQFSDAALGSNLDFIRVFSTNSDAMLVPSTKSVPVANCDPCLLVYRQHAGDEADPINVSMDMGGENITYGRKWLLPNANLDPLWDSLVFDSGIKQQLLNYAETALLFAEKRVSTSIIAWNRMILLHGPPGTGKTSMCQALAHKLSIRLCDRYRSVQLFEISTENLLSKWFSESAKFVSAMFQSMEVSLENPNCLVCLLVDEVESLATARNISSGSEPSDALRVVNSVLTHIDRLRRFPNVLVMTTSNVTKVLDAAFLDRADMRILVGNPKPQAIFNILASCIAELCKVGIIITKNSPSQVLSPMERDMLTTVSEKCQGMSGRSIRKLPLLAHAFHIVEDTQRSAGCTLSQFLQALEKVAESHGQQDSSLSY